MKKTLLALALTVGAWAHPITHPLDPLTDGELTEMVSILKTDGKLNDRSRFPMVTLLEPSKETVRSFKPGDPIRRQAFAVVLDRGENKMYEAVVDLTNHKLASWTPKPGMVPGVLIEEFEDPPKYVRSDPAWQAAIG